MQTTMSVNEAKANFSGMLSEVESGLVSFTIMRYGRPIARIVPIEQTRKIRPISGYGQKIADLTYCNSNVYHEIGLLMGRTLALTGKHEYGMTLILDENVSAENKIVKFNIGSLQQLRFKSDDELRQGLTIRLEKYYGVG